MPNVGIKSFGSANLVTALDSNVPIVTSPSSSRAPTCNCSEEEAAGDGEEEDEELIASYNQKRNSLGLLPSHNVIITEADDNYSHSSSFEELGAIGGISDDSRTATTDTNSSNNMMEQWQLVENSQHQQQTEEEPRSNSPTAVETSSVSVATMTQTAELLNATETAESSKKPLRRRSDGYLQRQRRAQEQAANSDDSPTSPVFTYAHNGSVEQPTPPAALAEQQPTVADKPSALADCVTVGCCQCCGRDKTTMRRRIFKMRQHLESSQLTEDEIKKELSSFLLFLEKRSKSLSSETETPVSSTISGNISASATAQVANHTTTSSTANGIARPEGGTDNAEFINENDGIYVYAASEALGAAGDEERYSRFIRLEDFESM